MFPSFLESNRGFFFVNYRCTRHLVFVLLKYWVSTLYNVSWFSASGRALSTMNWFFRDRLLTTWNDTLNLQQNSSWSEEKCEANVWVVPGQYCWFLAFSRAFRSWLVPFCISLAPCDICLSSDWLLRLLQLCKNSLYTTRMRRKTEAADYDCKLYKRRVTRFFRDYILTEFFRFFLVVTNFAEICTMGKFWALSASSKLFSRSAARIFELEELLENMVDHEDTARD